MLKVRNPDTGTIEPLNVLFRNGAKEATVDEAETMLEIADYLEKTEDEVERLLDNVAHQSAVNTELRCEVERMTPVYKAAIDLRQVWRDKGHGGSKETQAHVAIQKAVDQAEAGDNESV